GTALVGAIACYEDQEFMAYSKSKIIEAREMVIDAVKANDLEYFPTQTNFVFVKLPGTANTLRDKMAERDILIRGAYGDLTHWSRVSMGYIEDVARYVKALPQALNA
ncbi:MAG: aminotransferase class I/II-fold pyridoxal phosphate-dependent enzyme, partial [Amphiplicatus sp.]